MGKIRKIKTDYIRTFGDIGWNGSLLWPKQGSYSREVKLSMKSLAIRGIMIYYKIYYKIFQVVAQWQS